MFKNMRLVTLFDMLLNPSFKMMTGFANRANIDIYLYAKKDLKSLGIGSWKIILILNELKTSLMLKFSLQKSLQSLESFILIWCGSLLIYGNLK